MKISVIIPTLNEEQNLKKLLPFLSSEEFKSSIEIIVMDSFASKDDSQKICLEYPNIIYKKCEFRSRAQQMNEGSQMAQGNILFFLHADVLPPNNFHLKIISAIQQGFKMGFFSYLFNSEKSILKFNSSFTKRDGVFAGGGDQCHFFCKKTFQVLNGYDESFCIMEDFDMVRKIREKNIPYTIIDSPALVSARKYEKNSWLKVNLINLCVFVQFKFGVCPSRIRKTYKSLLREGV